MTFGSEEADDLLWPCQKIELGFFCPMSWYPTSIPSFLYKKEVEWRPMKVYIGYKLRGFCFWSQNRLLGQGMNVYFFFLLFLVSFPSAAHFSPFLIPTKFFPIPLLTKQTQLCTSHYEVCWVYCLTSSGILFGKISTDLCNLFYSVKMIYYILSWI